MLATYTKLLQPGGGSPPASSLGGLIFVLSLAVPVTLSLAAYNATIALVALTVLGVLIGGMLFFDVRRFAFYVFPAVFLLMNDTLIFATTLFLCISFLAGVLSAGRARIDIPYLLPLGLIMALWLVGLSQASDKDMARYAIQNIYLQPILIFLILYNLRPTSKQIRTHLFVICLVAAIIGWFTLGKYIITGYTRFLFLWPSQNLGATFLGMILPMALVSVLDVKRLEQRLVWGFILVGITAGIAVTQTRAIMLSSIIAIIYLGWKDRAILRIALPLLVVTVVVAPRLIITRMAMLVGAGGTVDWSAVGRIQIWANSLKLIPDYFLLGFGISNFGRLYNYYFPHSLMPAMHPHNTYLLYFFELGVIGLLAYIFIFFSSLHRGHRAIARVAGDRWTPATRLLLPINAAVLATLAACLVDAYLKDPRLVIMLWTLLAYQLLLAREAGREAMAIPDENPLHK